MTAPICKPAPHFKVLRAALAWTATDRCAMQQQRKTPKMPRQKRLTTWPWSVLHPPRERGRWGMMTVEGADTLRPHHEELPLTTRTIMFLGSHDIKPTFYELLLLPVVAVVVVVVVVVATS